MVMAVDIQEGNILIISIQEVVIQVVVEFILAGVGYIQVEVLAYILAVVGIARRVKYKKLRIVRSFWWCIKKYAKKKQVEF